MSTKLEAFCAAFDVCEPLARTIKDSKQFHLLSEANTKRVYALRQLKDVAPGYTVPFCIQDWLCGFRERLRKDPTSTWAKKTVGQLIRSLKGEIIRGGFGCRMAVDRDDWLVNGLSRPLSGVKTYFNRAKSILSVCPREELSPVNKTLYDQTQVMVGAGMDLLPEAPIIRLLSSGATCVAADNDDSEE